MHLYDGRIEELDHTLSYLEKQKEKYVIIADTNIAVNFDFRKFINAQVERCGCICCLYREEVPEGLVNADNSKDMLYTFKLENGRVTKWYINRKEDGVQNLGMNIYCFDREYLIDLVNEAMCMDRRIWSVMYYPMKWIKFISMDINTRAIMHESVTEIAFLRRT
ncbi:MAG: hypothetical protein V8R46_00275 [Eubacterium ramulus]